MQPRQNRLIGQPVPVELAKYRDLASYAPKIGDFVIWHGWFNRWYGLVIDIHNDELTIVKENLPKLLFCIPESSRNKFSIRISVTTIRVSRGGEYHVLQNGTWYVDD
jgi:hypothetical protein